MVPGAELLAARNWDARWYSLTARSRVAAASSTDVKLALTGVTAAETGASGAGTVGAEAAAVRLAELGRALVERPMVIPPMRIRTAAAACSHGCADPQTRALCDSRSSPSSLARAAMVRHSLSGASSRVRSRSMI